jgi:hypothetical protein
MRILHEPIKKELISPERPPPHQRQKAPAQSELPTWRGGDEKKRCSSSRAEREQSSHQHGRVRAWPFPIIIFATTATIHSISTTLQQQYWARNFQHPLRKNKGRSAMAAALALGPKIKFSAHIGPCIITFLKRLHQRAQ